MKDNMTICLWFDSQAEEAVNFYTSVFEDSETGPISRFGKEGFEHHGQPEGTAMSVGFRLNKMHFVALNGNSKAQFTDAISIQVFCHTQDEIDHYWSKLSEGGEESLCGWLKDRYGVSWQIIPAILPDYLTSGDADRKRRVEQVAFQMKKFEIEKIRKAYED